MGMLRTLIAESLWLRANEKTFSYDDEGQLIDKDGIAYTFDYEHRLRNTRDEGQTYNIHLMNDLYERRGSNLRDEGQTYNIHLMNDLKGGFGTLGHGKATEN